LAIELQAVNQKPAYSVLPVTGPNPLQTGSPVL
jgi:hypothetical protein